MAYNCINCFRVSILVALIFLLNAWGLFGWWCLLFRPPVSSFFFLSFSCTVLDCQESQIYEDIDRNSVTSNSTTGPDSSMTTATAITTTTDSGFSSARSRKTPVAGGSDDSWGSGEFESFSSDEDQDGKSRKVHSPT